MAKKIQEPKVKKVPKVKILYIPDPEDAPQPWQQQKGESPVVFSYFTRYRDLGPERTIKQVAVELHKSASMIGAHSQEWNWKARVRAYDSFLDKKRVSVIVKEVEDMTKRHIQQSMTYQSVLVLPAQAIIKRLQRDVDGSVKDFNGVSIDKLFDKVIKAAGALKDITDLERKSRGEPTDISKTDLTSDGKAIRVIFPKFEKPKDEAD